MSENKRSSDDNARIFELLCQLRDEAHGNNKDALRSTQANLLQSYKPATVMRVLVPFLFQSQGGVEEQKSLGSQEALNVMGTLVASDAANYLKPASRIVKEEVQRISTDGQGSLVVSPELVKVMVSQLHGNDVEVSVNATDALSTACRTWGTAFATSVVELIYQVWESAWGRLTSSEAAGKSQASTVCVRCASAMVDIAIGQDALMIVVAQKTHAASMWISMLQYDQDPLLQMTALDLVAKLSSSRPFHQSRVEWLFSDEVVKTVLQMAGGYEEEPDPILGGAALRVVSAMCKLLHLETGGDLPLLQQHHHLLTGFHHALHNWEHAGNDVDRLAIVDAISSFAGASLDALELVLDDPVTREAWLSLAVAQTKLKAAILVSVARVIDPPPEIDLSGDTVVLKPLNNAHGMKLYTSVGQANGKQDATTMLLSMIKSPVSEVRIGCYALMEAVAKLSRGGQVLFMNGDFFTFLTTRENESTKEGREAKYAIIEALLSSPVIGLLADDIVKQLEKYKAQGPHYATGLPWELATE